MLARLVQRRTSFRFAARRELFPVRHFRFVGKAHKVSAKDNESSGDKAVFEKHVVENILIEEIFELGSYAPDKTEKSARIAPVLPAAKSSRQFYLSAAFAVVLILLTGACAYFRYSNQQTASGSQIQSIAVLPMKSFASNQENEKLRLEITDSLITGLGGINNFTVRPTSAILPFANDEKDALEIGRKLAVDAILEGRVQQEGDKVRVTLQLVSVKTGAQIWAKQFDGESGETLKLQDQIIADFSQTFNQGDNQKAGKRPTENAEAYENYLKGRYFWQKRVEDDLRKAVVYFEKAIALDRDFADAYVGLADSQYAFYYSYNTAPENVTKAKDNLLKAITLNPASAEAFTTLGLIQNSFEWNWQEAEKSLKKAIELSPNMPNAHHRYGVLLVKLRRFAEAESELRRAVELDPTSPPINTNLGVVLYFSKKYDAAIAQFNKSFELKENFLSARWRLSRCYWQMGETEKALSEYLKTFHITKDEESARIIEQNLKFATPEAIILKLARNWESRLNQNSFNASDLAILVAHRLDVEKALRWTETTTNEHHPWATWMNAEPEFDFLRDDARFQKILRKMNFTR
jgi:TolB-like protein/Tfp pilus assembly protein PilF